MKISSCIPAYHCNSSQIWEEIAPSLLQSKTLTNFAPREEILQKSVATNNVSTDVWCRSCCDWFSWARGMIICQPLWTWRWACTPWKSSTGCQWLFICPPSLYTCISQIASNLVKLLRWEIDLGCHYAGQGWLDLVGHHCCKPLCPPIISTRGTSHELEFG